MATTLPEPFPLNEWILDATLATKSGLDTAEKPWLPGESEWRVAGMMEARVREEEGEAVADLRREKVVGAAAEAIVM
jgi:hypothetical protein